MLKRIQHLKLFSDFRVGFRDHKVSNSQTKVADDHAKAVRKWIKPRRLALTGRKDPLAMK